MEQSTIYQKFYKLENNNTAIELGETEVSYAADQLDIPYLTHVYRENTIVLFVSYLFHRKQDAHAVAQALGLMPGFYKVTRERIQTEVDT